MQLQSQCGGVAPHSLTGIISYPMRSDRPAMVYKGDSVLGKVMLQLK